MFTPEQRVEMWECYMKDLTYLVPHFLVKIFTMEEIMRKVIVHPTAMVRGLRNSGDLKGETRTVKLNPFIDQFLYIRGGENFEDCSSTKARKALMNGVDVEKYLHPKVIKLCRKFMNLNEQKEKQ